jgi:hypothetical protein
MNIRVSHDRDGLALLGLHRQKLHKLLDDAYAFRGQGRQQRQKMAVGREMVGNVVDVAP